MAKRVYDLHELHTAYVMALVKFKLDTSIITICDLFKRIHEGNLINDRQLIAIKHHFRSQEPTDKLHPYFWEHDMFRGDLNGEWWGVPKQFSSKGLHYVDNPDIICRQQRTKFLEFLVQLTE